MQHFSAAAISLGEKLKATAYKHNLDVNANASRHVADRIVHYLTEIMHVPFILIGGGLFQQNIRETSDADIKSVRSISNREMQNVMKIIAPRLEREDTRLHTMSTEPKVIDLKLGEPVDRYVFKATCGKIRGNTHLDISHGNGPGAFPKNVQWRMIPSLIRDGPALRVRCQPLAVAAAEKLLAVLMQSPTDMRVKHFSDIANEALWDGIDCHQVALEITRTCKARGIPMSACAEKAPALKWAEVSKRATEWEKHMSNGKTKLTLIEAHEEVCEIWSTVHEELRAQVINDYRRPNTQTTLADEFIAKCERKQMACQPSTGDI